MTLTLTACVDCVAFIADGTVPRERPDLAAEIEAVVPGLELSLQNEGDDGFFSWGQCQTCNSPLGGLREMVCAA
jgi:hypothetical protein